MVTRWIMAIAGLLCAGLVRAEQAPTVRGLFEAAWSRAECNQHIEQALNNAHYHELGAGYSLGMVLCQLQARTEAHILFLVAPRTGGRPQLLRFEAWIDRKFQPTDLLTMAKYHPATKTISSHQSYGSSEICGAAGEWTWNGVELKMTGYWDKPDCKDNREFDRSDGYRIFPPRM